MCGVKCSFLTRVLSWLCESDSTRIRLEYEIKSWGLCSIQTRSRDRTHLRLLVSATFGIVRVHLEKWPSPVEPTRWVWLGLTTWLLVWLSLTLAMLECTRVWSAESDSSSKTQYIRPDRTSRRFIDRTRRFIKHTRHSPWVYFWTLLWQSSIFICVTYWFLRYRPITYKLGI